MAVQIALLEALAAGVPAPLELSQSSNSDEQL